MEDMFMVVVDNEAIWEGDWESCMDILDNYTSDPDFWGCADIVKVG